MFLQQNLLDPPRQVLESAAPMEAEEERPETPSHSEEQQTATEEEEQQKKMQEKEQEQDHAKMPEHPGRDSDSGDSDEDQEA